EFKSDLNYGSASEGAIQLPNTYSGLAVESAGLGKQFGAQWAVTDLALEVEQRAIYGLLGPNGAGKTTAIRLMLGLLQPSRGPIPLPGGAAPTHHKAAAETAAPLPEPPPTSDHLPGHENLDSPRRLLGLPVSELGRVLDAVDMTSAAHRKVGHYSLG